MAAKDRYQLRFCAGKHWLLDMEQADGEFRAPMVINETAALILRHYFETEDLEKTAIVLQETYEIDKEEALQDVRDFLNSLPIQL